MRYNILILFLLISISLSCNKKTKTDLVVYPEYCAGCVSKNFFIIKNNNLNDKFNIYFDTTDLYILKAAKLNNLNYNHIDFSEIRPKFGDYANIVLIPPEGIPEELRTNEFIRKGKHF